MAFDRSTAKASDTIPDIYCETCHDLDNKFLPVAGFCQDCDEFLCTQCFTQHCRPKQMRHHQLLGKEHMPITKASTYQQKVEDKCPQHNGEEIKFFCNQHNQLCCKLCVTINHPRCTTDSIAAITTNIADSKDLISISDKLSSLQTGFETNLKKVESHVTQIKTCHTKAFDDIKTLYLAFDNLRKKTENEATAIKNLDVKKIETVSANCKVVSEQIRKLRSELETVRKSNQTESIFISMKRAEAQLESLDANLAMMNEDNKITDYTFKPDEQLETMLSNMDLLGEMYHPSNRTSIEEQSSKSPVHVNDITVGTPSDTVQCYITGSVLLNNNRLVITDWHNRKIKLLDTKQMKLTSELQVTGQPWDIAKIATDEIAVTTDEGETIQFVNVTANSMSLGRTISLNNKCRGIAYNQKEQTFIVAYDSVAIVEIINLTGTVLKTITTDNKGDYLFQCPAYVAINKDASEIYVSDNGKSTVSDSSKATVTLLTTDGAVKDVYKSNDLRSPRKVIVHQTGIVYVVCNYSNTVYQLVPGTNQLRPLLDSTHGLSSPYSITYDEKEDRMYIGMTSSNLVKVFHMKKQ